MGGTPKNTPVVMKPLAEELGIMPIATGMLMDKYRKFEGEPTQTIELRKTVTLEDVCGELEQVKRVPVDAELVD